MKAIVIEEHGGSERLRTGRLDDPQPGTDELLVRVAAAGVNFLDIYQREGRYRVSLPFVPGVEAAGEVVALGDGASGFSVGELVAYTGVPGAYAELQRVPAARAVKVPAGVEPRQAAAAMLQGMTAHYLSHAAFALRPGHTCLIHAAAGGTGGLLVQMASRLGARVLATVSSEAKAELARQAGADLVIRYDREDFVDRVVEATGGEGVDVVYDGVGAATFERGLDALKRRGTMVLFGAASGPVKPFDLRKLGAKGSLFVTRPSLEHYVSEREELERRAGDVLSWVASGELRLRIDSARPLDEAAEAHRRLESRASAGKLLLIP
jgi:NADPH:quinone reductase